jgi:hypothetical protein
MEIELVEYESGESTGKTMKGKVEWHDREPRGMIGPLEDHGIQRLHSQNGEINLALNRIDDIARKLNEIIFWINKGGV